MAHNSLSNSPDYTIHFTADAYKKHQRLIYIGSVMSQFLRQSYFCLDTGERLSYQAALHEMEQFMIGGKRYSCAWDELAIELQATYNAATQRDTEAV